MAKQRRRIPIVVVDPSIHSYKYDFDEHIKTLRSKFKGSTVACVFFSFAQLDAEQSYQIGEMFEDVALFTTQRDYEFTDPYWKKSLDAIGLGGGRIIEFNLVNYVDDLITYDEESAYGASEGRLLDCKFYEARLFYSKLFGSFPFLGDQIKEHDPDFVVTDIYIARFLTGQDKAHFYIKDDYLPQDSDFDANSLKNLVDEYFTDAMNLLRFEKLGLDQAKIFFSGRFFSKKHDEVNFEAYAFDPPLLGPVSGIIVDEAFGIASFEGSYSKDRLLFKKKYFFSSVLQDPDKIVKRQEIYYEIWPKKRKGQYHWPDLKSKHFPCEARILQIK